MKYLLDFILALVRLVATVAIVGGCLIVLLAYLLFF